MLINTSFAYVQYEEYGFVSTSMILVWIFQMFYIIDYFWNEEAILTTMDIKHENFGYMLAFGDLVWVPMTYSLQAHYLIDRVHSLPWWGAVLIVLTNMLGLYIFRAVNLQKHKFRGDPDERKNLGQEGRVPGDRTGREALALRVLGLVPPLQLRRRHPDGPLVVPPVPLRFGPPLLLPNLLRDPPHPPRAQRPQLLLEEIRRRLDPLLRTSPLPNHPRHLLGRDKPPPKAPEKRGQSPF